MARSSKVAAASTAGMPVRSPIDIQIERWPIERLKPYPGNARTHSDAQIRQIAASMTEFGWTNPIDGQGFSIPQALQARAITGAGDHADRDADGCRPVIPSGSNVIINHCQPCGT